MSGPAELEEMKRKIYILENRLGKKCFPDYETIMLFYDKVMEFYLLNLDNLPVAKTFISHNYSEIYSSINKLNYPLVNKLSYGAGSREVSMVKNEKQARKIVHNSFSLKGRRSNVSYYRQKNYVYLQEFVDGEGLDTRITVIGNMIFGYYRKPKKGDFRASGSGIVIKRDLPIEAIKIALETYYKIGKAMLAVDMVKDKNGQYKIIEISPYIWVITPIQMMVNGIIGGYKLHPDGTLEFVKCSCWPQELALKTFFEQTYLSNPDKWKQQFIKPAIETGNLRKI
jgi:glutathione synthase/RimK-type ligase-like ATP-grasp enzyme